MQLKYISEVLLNTPMIDTIYIVMFFLQLWTPVARLNRKFCLDFRLPLFLLPEELSRVSCSKTGSARSCALIRVTQRVSQFVPMKIY